MATHRVGLISVVALTAMVFLASSREVAGQPSLSGSEAVRAEKCAGDYACDEDGSWSAAHACPRSRLTPQVGAASRTLEEPMRAVTEDAAVRWGFLDGD